MVGVCTSCSGGGQSGDSAWLLPPYWVPRPEVCRAALLVASASLPPSLPPSLPLMLGWPSCIPGTLPRICIFEAMDTDRGFNESKVASRALTDARPRYYF